MWHSRASYFRLSMKNKLSILIVAWIPKYPTKSNFVVGTVPKIFVLFKRCRELLLLDIFTTMHSATYSLNLSSFLLFLFIYFIVFSGLFLNLNVLFHFLLIIYLLLANNSWVRSCKCGKRSSLLTSFQSPQYLLYLDRI